MVVAMMTCLANDPARHLHQNLIGGHLSAGCLKDSCGCEVVIWELGGAFGSSERHSLWCTSRPYTVPFSFHLWNWQWTGRSRSCWYSFGSRRWQVADISEKKALVFCVCDTGKCMLWDIQRRSRVHTACWHFLETLTPLQTLEMEMPF